VGWGRRVEVEVKESTELRSESISMSMEGMGGIRAKVGGIPSVCRRSRM
jgi:hypothetical protein